MSLRENVTSEDVLLPGLCDEPLWSPSSAWYTEEPHLGRCAERTVLLWTPCLLLWVSTPYVFALKRRPYNPVPWSALAYTKVTVTGVLMAAAGAEGVWAAISGYGNVTLADILAPLILLATYILYLSLLLAERRRGKRSSGVLWTYWLVALTAGIPQLITAITTTIQQDRQLPPVLVATFIIQYLGYMVLFIASCVNDVPSRLQRLTKTKNQTPEVDASFLNRLLFFYNHPLIWRGWRRPLVSQDIPEVLPKNSAEAVYREWRSTLDRKEGRKWKDFMVIGKVPTVTTTQTKVKVSLLRHIWRHSHSAMLLLLLNSLVTEAVTFLSPVLVGWLIGFMEDENEPTWHGYFYAVCLLVVCGLRCLIKGRYIYGVFTVACRIRTALMAAVYNKAIHLSCASRRRYTVGEIVNLMAVDAQSVGNMFIFLGNVVVAPAVVLVTFGLVWLELGPSAMAGLVVMTVLVPLNSYIISCSRRVQGKVMKLTDARVKALTEIITGIKVLKLYAWETSFTEKVKDIRRDEIKLLKKYALLQSLNTFLFQTIPFFIALATFTCYLLVSEENQLDAQKAFVCLTLFDILRVPALTFPEMVSYCIQAAVSIRRMERYLNADELEPLAVTTEPRESAAVVVQGGQFLWEGDEEQASWRLKDIEMNVPHGRLVALVGTVGSGKSSMLSALLGEMKKDAGKVVVNGCVAYVPQQPWLQNATLRDNITWGEVYEPQRYQQVVLACALQPDFDMLPAGDLTEVGENGINMSGGQKQRVSLARAVYSNANIFLLDDPLSAVDSHVGSHIFNHVVGPKGLLKDKTRILVTHAVTFLPQVDEVMVMQDGQLVERGRYTSLLASEGSFARFIVQHIKDLAEDEAEEEMEQLCDQLEDVARNTDLYRQLSSTKQSLRNRGRPATPTLNNSKWSVASKNSGSLGLPQRQRHLSTDSSKAALAQMANGSTNSLNSHAAKDEHEDEVPEERNKGQKLVEEEASETGRISYHVYFTYIKAMGVVLTSITIIGLTLSQICYAGSSAWLAQWSSSQHNNLTNSTTASRDTFLLVYGLLTLGQSFFLFLGILTLALSNLGAANTLHSRLLTSVMHFPMSFFDTNPSGRVLNRFGKEMNKVDNNLPLVVRSFSTILSRVVTTLVMVMAATPVVASFVVPIMLVYFVIQRIFVATSRQIMRLESVSKAPIYSHFSESITGVSVIRAFRRQNEFFSQSLQKIENLLKTIYGNLNANRWLAVYLEAIGNLITFSAAVFGVAFRETTSPGALGLSLNFALSITILLNWLVRTVSDLEASIVSVEKVDEYLKLPQEAAWRVDKGTPPSTWPEEGAIKFHNYETRYRPGLSLVLHGITCFIRPAEKVGIVGRTGAGKSSLTMALFRIIEASGGRIDIDNIAIGNIGLHDLRSQISIIPQDAVLFSGTLRMNLDPLDQHSDDELWRVLELAHLSGYIRKQMLGLQHPVDQSGSNFSAGQKQLLCLARALLRHSRVLVLDEATAAVDLETDDLIQTTIRTQFAECTVITIAHRLNTIMDSDRVMVLQAGRIAEFDAPSVLLQQPNSLFYSMAKDAGIV